MLEKIKQKYESKEFKKESNELKKESNEESKKHFNSILKS